jgi:hypothetical protein
LCLLAAHSTGSSWAGLCFLALSPLLLLAAYVLEREGLASQAFHALLGAGLVGTGALVLAFAGNRDRLSDVPSATFFALALGLLILRAWRPLLQGAARESAGSAYSLAACVALIGAAFYGVRAMAGVPAWGAPHPWAWEMPCVAVLGLSMTVIGGALRLEPVGTRAFAAEQQSGAARHSLVAQCGAWVSAAALTLAFVHLLFNGSHARYLCISNTLYLDALIVCLVLCAGTALAAGRWLNFAAARFLAPAGVLAGYALSVGKWHPEAWEWYSVPAAFFLFVWAWQAARASEAEPGRDEPQGEVNGLLALASALAVAPSFIQALPLTPAGTQHFFILLGLGLAMVLGAMLWRRRIPLLAGSGAVIMGLLVKAVQLAHNKAVLWPVVGIALGSAVVALGMLFEQRMNQAFRKAVDRARAEAKMFWVSWE